MSTFLPPSSLTSTSDENDIAERERIKSGVRRSSTGNRSRTESALAEGAYIAERT